MNNFILCSFEHNLDFRKFLRLNKIITKSSIYLINKMKYIVVKIDTLMQITNNVIIINRPIFAEEFLYNWAIAEIIQSLQFVQLETKSIYIKNGRMLSYNEIEIIRSFEFLADIMAIINYTHNSFSDGGKYNTIDLVISRAVELINSGATIIDIGFEATNPQSKRITAFDEISQIKQVLPLLCELKKAYQFQISIDSYHSQTIEHLQQYDIDIINDVSGNIQNTLNSNKKYICMHSVTIPAGTNGIALNINPVEYIYSWMNDKIEQIEQKGISLDNIIFDPGIGFGNNQAQAWFLLNNIKHFTTLNCQLLIGHSRKSFFSHITDNRLRDIESAMVAAKIVDYCDYIRLHELTILNQIYPVINQLAFL